jgi:hypothetical protein
VTEFGFPSGHSAENTVFFGMLVINFLFPALSQGTAVSSFWRVVVALVAFAIVVLVGLARIAIAAHFPDQVSQNWNDWRLWYSFHFEAGLRICDFAHLVLHFHIATPISGDRWMARWSDGIECIHVC